ncbi:MAG TPA: ArsA family ATPase [Gemmatimonadaceae bacterium]|nr:ArsA family ATPase [Gemmatimonadaceae bacterium]
MTSESGASGSADLLAALPRWIIVGGKGGVGKTTIAIALAKAATGRVLLLSTDPARALGPALGEPVGPHPIELRSIPGVFAQQLDAAVERDAFLARWRETLVTVIDRGTYLDREDIVGFIDAVLPGTDEAMALLSLADLAASSAWDRVIIDTAPTGHTLRLFALPQTFRLVVDLLELMQEKHRFMVRALTHRYRADAVDAMLTELRQRVDALRALLTDPGSTRLVLVARAEPLVVAETERYAAALPALGLTAGALVVNAVSDDADPSALASLASLLPGIPHVSLARWPESHKRPEPREWPESRKRPESREWPESRKRPEFWTRHPVHGDEARSAEEVVAGDPAWLHRRLHSDEPRTAEDALRPLTIVGGKGGVGKTTVACALAIEAASDEQLVLVVSTDPAPSIADALGLDVGDETVAIAPGLWARQANATAAFAEMQKAYRQRVDAVFDRLIGAGFDAAHDRKILQDLFALAPPGIDELYALATIGETLAAGQFDTIIVDPAPTGHLLRLLETPALALDWSHRIMRLALKYKEIASFTETMGDILTFAQRTRAVRDLLADPARSTVILVTLDEPLVRSETERLTVAVATLGLTVGAVIWNRSNLPLSASGAVPQFAAPEESPSPRGLAALKQWYSRWRA